MRWFKKQAVALRVWAWYGIEQFAVLFIPKPSVESEGFGLIPCSTCWWYRGVILGFALGALAGYLFSH